MVKPEVDNQMLENKIWELLALS